ncbi:MAG: Tex-like N-terminal domain-containing protein, partial [Desulfobacterales bacterium]
MSYTRFTEKIAREQNLEPWQAAAAAGLLEQGSSVPFISRY